MANHFNHLMNDIITVVNKDGSRHEDIRASVQREMIVTFDVTVHIATGDKIERILPSAQKEVFIVRNAHLNSGAFGIESFYEISYEREDAQHLQAERPAAINVRVSGSPQARVNLHSTDESVNVSNAQSEIIFSELRDLLQKSVNDVSDRELLLKRVEDMERSLVSGDFKTAYQNFMVAAANHMTILAPVLPALVKLL